MKKFKFMTVLLCFGIVLSGCNNLGKGTAIGTDQYFDEGGAKDWDLGLTAGGKFEFGDYRVGAYYNYGLMHVWPGAGHNMTYGISLGYAF